MTERKFINVTGVQNDPASLCMAEHLVASFILESVTMDSMISIGAAIALQCFVDPDGVRAALDGADPTKAMASIAAQGKREAKDIHDSVEVVERLASLAQFFPDEVVDSMIPETETGSKSRVEMLRQLEGAFLNKAFED